MNVVQNGAWVDGIPWVAKAGVWVKGTACHVVKGGKWVDGDCGAAEPMVVSGYCKQTHVYYVAITFDGVPVVLNTGNVRLLVDNGWHDIANVSVNGNTLEGSVSTADFGTATYCLLSIEPNGVEVDGVEILVDNYAMTLVATLP